MASVALPKQLQHILKQANIRITQHEYICIYIYIIFMYTYILIHI